IRGSAGELRPLRAKLKRAHACSYLQARSLRYKRNERLSVTRASHVPIETALVDYPIDGLFRTHQIAFLHSDKGSSFVTASVPTSLCFSRLLDAPGPPGSSGRSARISSS